MAHYSDSAESTIIWSPQSFGEIVKNVVESMGFVETKLSQRFEDGYDPEAIHYLKHDAKRGCQIVTMV